VRVIHLSTEDQYGAGRTAVRISDAVRYQGIDSDVYVIRHGMGSYGYEIHRGVYEQIKAVIDIKRDEMKVAKYSERALFNPAGGGIDFSKAEFIREADVINLHWVNYGVWSQKLMCLLAKLKKPIVWTMHDMWPFTGGCHCDENCGRYSKACGTCPVLQSNDVNDISAKSLSIKSKLYAQNNITFVGPSRWMTESANNSAVIRNNNLSCVNIGNPISGDEFIPRDKNECFKLIRLNTKKKVILFGAVNATSDRNKGFENLKKALSKLDRSKYLLLIFGGNIKGDFAGFETVSTGFISDDLHLSLIYNVADVFVAPSFQDNLPNTVMEALCCGVPVAAFNIGGMPDMIIPGENGYLAGPYDCDDLAGGIKECANRIYDRDSISNCIRRKYSAESIGELYKDLYFRILQGNNS